MNDAPCDLAPAGDRCRHCRVNKAAKPARRLCSGCFDQPAVRAAYPLVPNRYNRRGVGAGPAKVAVLADRAAAGQSLWHPRDAR